MKEPMEFRPTQQEWTEIDKIETLMRLKAQGFTLEDAGDTYDPTTQLGTALRMAEKYNLRLTTGFSRWQAKVYLPAEFWIKHVEKISAEGPGMTFLNILNQPGWCDRNTVEEAICHGLLLFREQGLL